jgi:hypothetical protein
VPDIKVVKEMGLSDLVNVVNAGVENDVKFHKYYLLSGGEITALIEIHQYENDDHEVYINAVMDSNIPELIAHIHLELDKGYSLREALEWAFEAFGISQVYS